MSDPLTAKDIIHWLCGRWMQSFLLPNYTPANWWECDVFEITKAGYFREYEVKVSRADFFADAKKGTARRELVGGRTECNHMMQLVDGRYDCRDCGGTFQDVQFETKHGLLDARSTRGPSRFWYVVPTGLVTVAEVPVWAGLMEVSSRGVHETRRAPKIHKSKVDSAVERDARDICYYRMHEYRRKVKAVAC